MASSIDRTRGSNRTDLSTVAATEIESRKTRQLLVEDFRRTRPKYFDGRFLAARDLTREQVYALSRQADLSVAHHGGVIRGLELVRFGDALRVTPGIGFTPNGELVSLNATLSTTITQIPEDDRIDLSHGLVDVAEPAARGRTGLYLLGIRPGEYATKATTRFPLTTRGTPGTEDGDIVEAIALALHPLRHAAESAESLRGDLARRIFLERGGDPPANLLPLAVVYLRGGAVAWLDPHLVRRDVTADDRVSIGLGNQERARAEAHFLQYDRHLAEVVSDLRARGGLRFPASRYFRCLPPVGRMPAAAIEPTEFTQAYFPPQMTVTMSIVVDHELPSLLEAAMNLPPIDLEGTDEDFDFTYIQILVPMPAPAIERLQLQRVTVPRLTTPPAALAKRLPVLALRDFLIKRRPPPPVEGPDFGHETRKEAAPLLAAWRQALAAAPDQLVWFVRVPTMAVAPAMLFDPPPKSKEKDKEKEKEKDKEADKSATEDKTGDKTGDKTDDKASDKTGDKAAEKTDDKAIVADKSEAADKAASDKPVAADKVGDKLADKTTDKTVIADKPGDKTVLEKTGDKAPENKTSDKVGDKTNLEKTAEKAPDNKPGDKINLEKAPDNKPSDKVGDKTIIEKTAEKAGDTKSPRLETKVGEVIVTPTPSPTGPGILSPTPVTGPGRTFIQPTERPDVGGTVRKPRDT